jgi:hypothetical protein
VHLGGGPDGGARGDRWALLLDRDRRRDPLDPVDQRLGHPLQKLLGIGRQRFDVAPLPFGVEGVERERGLAAARRAGDHHQRPSRDVDGEPLEVVLAGVDDANHGTSHEGKCKGLRDGSGDGSQFTPPHPRPLASFGSVAGCWRSATRLGRLPGGTQGAATTRARGSPVMHVPNFVMETSEGRPTRSGAGLP